MTWLRVNRSYAKLCRPGLKAAKAASFGVDGFESAQAGTALKPLSPPIVHFDFYSLLKIGCSRVITSGLRQYVQYRVLTRSHIQ